MKKILFTLALLWSVAYGQFCADEDTVRSNSATQITATTARINGTTSHFTGAVVSLQLKYVRVGQTDTVTSSGTGALRNLTGLQPATQYVYYYKSICGSGSQSQTIGPYRFTTLANTILYVDERPTRFYHWKADSSMIVAQGDTVVGREPSTFPQIRYKTSDNTFYGYYPNCACWRALAIDSSGIIGLLDGKVDSVTVNGDSLFYWKVGVSYGYILPSLNSVWRNTGNSGIDTSVNWLGTNDNKDLVIKTNATRRFTVNVNGALGVGNPADYGTSGYRLQTNGSGSGISWVDNTISSLTAASASNTINNSNYKQTWQWNSLSATGLELSTTTTASNPGSVLLSLSRSGANSTGSRSTYGLAITNQHTGTNATDYALFSQANLGTTTYSGAFLSTGTSTAYGVYSQSTGAGTNIAGYFNANSGSSNYAIIVPGGGGMVGIGTLTPAAVFHTVGTVRMASMGSASTDTSTYKPMGISSLGDVIPMASWYGSGGGSSGLTIGGTSITSGTNDRILYQSGGVVQQSSNLVFNSSNELIIGGTDNGSAVLQVNGGTALFKGALEVNNHTFYNDANVAFTISDNSRSYLFNMYNNGNHVLSLSRAQGYMRLGPTIASTSAGVMFQVDARSATDKGLLIKGASSQSANLIEAQDNSSNVLFSVNQNGTVRSRNVIYQTINASDADFTAAVGTAYVLPDPSTGRTITLPTGQDADKILFYLPVSPSNSWNLSTNVTILDGSTVNKLDAYGPGAIYLIYDGANSVWRLIPNM